MTETTRPVDDAAVKAATLTLEQQASLTSGEDVWHFQGIEEAGIAPVMVSDGPHGLRREPDDNQMNIGNSAPATCFPPAVTLACTWDTDLLRRVGEALGRETRAAGVSVLLGPGVNIKRHPLCGRNFEYFSEDPFLAGRLGAAYVHGVQSQGVGTSVKHFAANNQETDRQQISADIDERTLREIYLAAFEHIVKDARPATVMAAYNKINGTYATENTWLLTQVLRGEWGFEGVVMSDWVAVVDRVRAFAAGTDVEMPPTHSDELIVRAVEAGTVDAEQLQAAAARVIRLADATAKARDEPGTFDEDTHHRIAREAAAAGAVLLKNDGDLLPLNPDGDHRIAVIGEFARTPRCQGAGSSQVVPTRLENALDAITALAGVDRVSFAPGFSVDEEADDESRAALTAEAVRAAREAEVAVLFLGLPPTAESEGFDRTDFELPADQILLLEAVHQVNRRTVVVLSNGSAVSVAPWQAHAPALLEAWLGGQAGGPAVADLLFGLANPTGRLAETIPLRLQDAPSYLFFPGGERHVRYGEGVYVGYRHHDTLDRPVAYPFGHGLSYTTFELGDVAVVPAGDNAFDVTVPVANTGDRSGAQIVQVYVRDLESSIDRPLHELKGFAKVDLAPGETGSARVHLDERAFAFWSIAENRWKIEPGQAEIRVGFSSRDIRARQLVDLTGDTVAPALDAMSTLDEWLADPVGAQLMGPVIAPYLEPGEGKPENIREVLGAMPLTKIANFGGPLTHDHVDALVAEHRKATASIA
ncbi:beta-glucosidase [Streptodolium elevatio]